MKISKGLTQAYQLQDFAFEALMSLRAVLTGEDGKLNLTREDASAIVSLQKAWQGCQERISFHRRVPSPGSLKPERPKPKGRTRPPIAPLAWPKPIAPCEPDPPTTDPNTRRLPQRNHDSVPGVMRPLIKVSLFNAASENDFTLLEDNGEFRIIIFRRKPPAPCPASVPIHILPYRNSYR